MAFREKYINEIFGSVLVLSALLSTASAVDCFGKSFHCVNSTHFMICVDLGGGVSQSIDDFLIPCPPPTECRGNNHFECEFPAVTTPSTTLSNVKSETTEPWEEIVVTTNTPPRNSSTTKEYSEKYMNTVSITNVSEDNLTTDTTADGSVVTEASSLNYVNSNLNTTEIVPTSEISDMIIGLDRISETIPDNIVTVAMEITTDLPQVKLVHDLRNDTNETTTDYAPSSVSVTESTIAINNKNVLSSNDTVGEANHIAATNNVTSTTVFENTTTPDTLLVDSNYGTQQPLTTITDDRFVTGVNLVATMAQTLVSKDGLQNSVNSNIQTTTPEPATVRYTLDVEQFQRPVFGENLMNESIRNFTGERPIVSTPDIEYVSTQLPITTSRSTVNEYITTAVNIKDEVTSDTTPTTIYEEKFSTAGYSVYTTEVPLIITTKGNQDIQDINDSGKASKKVIYMGSEQPTKNVNSLPTSIDEKIEQPNAFTTETLNLHVTEPPNINKNSLTIEALQVPTDTGIESTNRPTNTYDAALESNVLPDKTQKPIEEGSKQSKNSTNILAIAVDTITEHPSKDTTEVEQQIVTSVQPKTNKTSSTDNDMGIRVNVLPIEPQNIELQTSIKSLAGDNSITENPSDLNTKTHTQLVTEQTTIKNESPATGTDMATEANVLHTEAQNLKQLTSVKSLADDNNPITENPSGFKTETHRQIVTEQSTINNISLTTVSDVRTEASVLRTESHNVEQPTTENLVADNNSITENPSELKTELNRQKVTERPTINNNSPATDNDIAKEASVLPTEAQNVEQSTIKNLVADINSITEIPNKFQSEPNRQLVTERPTINNNSPAIDNNVATEASVLPTEQQNVERPTTKDLVADNKSITENLSGLKTEPNRQKVTERPTINNNSPATDNDIATEASVLPTEAQNVEQPTTKNLVADNNYITEISSKFYSEPNRQLVTERPTINDNSSATDNDIATKANVLSKDAQNVEQPTAKNLIADNNSTHRQLVIEQTTKNYNSLATLNEVATEASVLLTEDLKQVSKGIEQPTMSTKSLLTENTGALTTVTLKPFNINTEQPTTIKNEFVTDIDVVTEKASVSATGSPELTKQIIEKEKSIFMVVEQPTTNKNPAMDNDAKAEKAHDATAEDPSALTSKTPKDLVIEQVTVAENSSVTSFDAATEAKVLLTESQNAIYRFTKQSITSTKSLAADKDAINDNSSAFKTETQNTIYMSSPLPSINKNSLANDIDVTTEKASVSDVITKTQYSISTSTKLTTTVEKDFASDSALTTETANVSPTATIKSTRLIEEGEGSDLIDKNVETGQQQGILTTDAIVRSTTERNIINFTKITTDAMIVQSNGVTEKPIATASKDNVEVDLNTLNIIKLHKNAKSNNETNVTYVVELNNVTTTESTTAKNEYSHISLDATPVKKESVAIASNTKTSDTDIVNKIPVDNFQTINIITEKSHQNTFDVMSGTVESLIPTTVKSVNVKKDKTDLTNGVTTDIVLNIENEINVSPTYINNKDGTTSAFGITEVNSLNPNTEGSNKQDIRKIAADNSNDQLTTESILTTGIGLITKDTTLNNVDGNDIGISHIDTVISVANKTERVNLIPAAHVAKQLPTTVTVNLGQSSVTNLNGLNDTLDTNLKQAVNDYSKISNSAYSEQVIRADATSETTATDKFTPSLNPTSETSRQNIITSNNQLTTEKINTIVNNVAERTSSFTTISSTTLNDKDDDLSVLLTENVKVDTLTTLNTQDTSHVRLTTEKAMSYHGNVVEIPDSLSTVNEKVIHKTVQSSTQTNDFTSSPVQAVNKYVDDATTIRGVIDKTRITFAEKSTSGNSEIDLELPASTKNETIQQVETKTQFVDNVQPPQTVAPVQNENANNLFSNPLSNILLDKIKQAVTENSVALSTKNDRKIINMDILRTATVLVTDDSFTQLPLVQNTNDMTTQGIIPSVQTNNNLPISRFDNPSETDGLQKITQVASQDMITDNPSVTHPKTTTLKETYVPKEEISKNVGNDATPLDLSPSAPATKSSTEFPILVGVKNLYNTIRNSFHTPSETSTLENIINNPNDNILSTHPTYDIQYSSKTSPSIYNTESSIIEKKENLPISKLGPISTVSILPTSIAFDGDNSKTTNIEMSTEVTTNNDASVSVLNKPEISKAFPTPNYKMDINSANVNQQIPNKQYGIVTSETKISKDPYSSISNPSEDVNISQYSEPKSNISPSYKDSGTTVSTILNVSQQAVNAFKTETNNLPGQSNEHNVDNHVINDEKTNAASKTTVRTEYKNVSQSTIPESSINVTYAVNAKNYSNPQQGSATTSSKITEKADLATKSTEAKNNGIISKNVIINNDSAGSWKAYQEKNTTVTDTVSKNVSRGINKKVSTSTRNSTHTAKSNTQANFEPQQNMSRNPTSHVAETIKPTAPVTTATQVPTTKITSRPSTTTTATIKNPSQQIPNTPPVNYNCINGVRGRYSDKDDCRKFYICIGNSQPIVGNCPANTVFSDISKLCTKNLSHCIRENEFKCPSAGRFSDAINDNVYYICVSHKNHLYRFKFQCQKGFTLNKAAIKCIENKEIVSNESASISISENSSDGSISSQSSSSSSSSSTSSSSSSGSDSMNTSSDSSSSSSSSSTDSSSSSSSTDSSSSDSSSSRNDSSNDSNSRNLKRKKKKETKEKKESKEKPEGNDEYEEDEVFECEKEGKFPVRNDCRRYYLCKKNGKSEYRRKIKRCESGDVFHKDKKNSENSNESDDSENDSDGHHSNRRQRKEKKEKPESRENDKQELFECEREGKFPIPGDCRRYYLCKRNRKSVYRRNIKKCDSDEVFHRNKKKCVDAESYEC